MVSVWIAPALLLMGGAVGFLLARRGARRSKAAHLPLEAVFGAKEENLVHKRNAIYAQVFNLVPDTLTLTRIADGKFVEVNQNWEDLTGFTRAEAIGHTSAELGVWVEPEQRVHLIETLKRDGVVRNFDVTFKHKQGHRYYNKVAANLFQFEGETYMLLAVRDITAKRAADLELLQLNQTLEERVHQRTLSLEQSNAELGEALATLRLAQDELVRSEKMAALGSLVAGVAHELNTPIGNGLTVATTLEHRLQEFQQQKQAGLRRSDLEQLTADAQFATDVLVRNLTRAGELVRSFKQVAVDRTSSQMREFSLQELVSEIMITLSPVISRSGCEVLVDVPTGLDMQSYPGPLGQVLDNLINNALIHAFPDGRRGHITVQARPLESEALELVVRDDGAGIAPEHLGRIFDPFFTTRMGQGGSGLGLHIVHNIVTDVLGGRIAVASQPEAGATFTLTLPRQAPQA